MASSLRLPGFEITVDPRVDRRLVEGLDVAGQNYHLRRIAVHELRQRNGWNRLGVRPLYQVLIGAMAADQAIDRYAAGSDGGDDADQQEPAEPRRFDGLLRHRLL